MGKRDPRCMTWFVFFVPSAASACAGPLGRDHSEYVIDICKWKGRRASRAFTIGDGLLHIGVVARRGGK